MITQDILNTLILALKDKVGNSKEYAIFVKEECLPEGIGWIVLGENNKAHELMMSSETVLTHDNVLKEDLLDWASKICRNAVDKFEECRINNIEWPEPVSLEEKYGKKQNGEESLPI